MCTVKAAAAPACRFDGPCDTALQLPEGSAFVQPERGRHVSLPQTIEADVRAQVVACFVLESEHPGRADERAGELLDALEQLAARTEGELRIARTQRRQSVKRSPVDRER